MSTPLGIRTSLGLNLTPASPEQPQTVLGDLPPFDCGRLHEVVGAQGRALALSLASQCLGRTFWVSERTSGVLRAAGLRTFISPDTLTFIHVAGRDEALWASEQALRCAGAGLVVVELRRGPDLFESRRMQIAARIGGGLGLAVIRGPAQSSAAQTRWSCAMSSELGHEWRWRLLKNKWGVPGEWSVRGDPDPVLTHPPDLVPADLSPSHAFTLATTACAASATTAAGSLAPA